MRQLDKTIDGKLSAFALVCYLGRLGEIHWRDCDAFFCAAARPFCSMLAWRRSGKRRINKKRGSERKKEAKTMFQWIDYVRETLNSRDGAIGVGFIMAYRTVTPGSNFYVHTACWLAITQYLGGATVFYYLFLHSLLKPCLRNLCTITITKEQQQKQTRVEEVD